MIIRRLRLSNIRSYEKGEIVFPEGSVILSGDIGAGKSSALLAIDFALFGLQNELTGAALLRHGTDEGDVELDFELEGKEFTIKRTLKRSKRGVGQKTGFIISDGVQKDLSAQESRAYILDLLGYPAEALKKDSALLYRYTVYTPQEQMRSVIEAKETERLELIRRLFAMDRYARIADNASTYALELRGRARELLGTVSDLPEKEKRKEEITKESELAKSELSRINDEEKSARELLLKRKKALDELAKEAQGVSVLKEEYASLKTDFDYKKSAGLRAKSEVARSKEQIKALLAKELELGKVPAPKTGEKEASEHIRELLKTDNSLLSETSSLKTKIDPLMRILDNGQCGTCGQSVSDPKTFREGIELMREQIKLAEKKREEIKISLAGLERERLLVGRYALAKSELETLALQKKDLSKNLQIAEAESKELLLGQKELAEKINVIASKINSSDVPKRQKELSGAYDAAAAGLRKSEIAKSAITTKIESLDSQLKLYGAEIGKKKEKKKEMEDCQRMAQWTGNFFAPLMATIEKHAMATISQEFGLLFSKWFSMLVEDDSLSARVDETFSVVITQDGFDTQYEFLSGGERTAIALAYRLALNRAINTLTEHIRTKDLLILDEPTDGFSGEQIDSVRDILNELACKQVIIVSHDQKVENFVENVLRFDKKDGISRIL